jgi:hypothetical protein
LFIRTYKGKQFVCHRQILYTVSTCKPITFSKSYQHIKNPQKHNTLYIPPIIRLYQAKEGIKFGLLVLVKSKLKTYTLAKALHNKHNNKIYAHATNQKKAWQQMPSLLLYVMCKLTQLQHPVLRSQAHSCD